MIAVKNAAMMTDIPEVIKIAATLTTDASTEPVMASNNALEANTQPFSCNCSSVRGPVPWLGFKSAVADLNQTPYWGFT